MDKLLIAIAAAILTFSSWHIQAAPMTEPSDKDPISTERNQGPPALSPAETRQLKEQEIRQLQQGSQNNEMGTVPVDNGGAPTFPSNQPGQPNLPTQPNLPSQDQNSSNPPK